jgi:LEA14-like dessication related protein
MPGVRAMTRTSLPTTAPQGTKLPANTRSRVTVAVLLLLLISGCASVRPTAAPPEVSFEHIRIVDAGVQRQRYALTVSVFNPNSFDVPVQDLVYQLELNGTPFAAGRLDPGPTLPARDAVTVELTFDTDLAATTRQLVSWLMRGTTHLDYRLTGEARIRRFGTQVFKFDENGTIGLDALRLPR